MKRILLAVVVATCIFGSFTASAKRVSFGLGLEGGLPQGDAANLYNFTGGLTARFNVHAGPGYATFTTGGIAFVPKSLDGKDIKAGLQIPFKFGYKYVFMKHFFGMMELGYTSFTFYTPSSTSGGEITSQKSGGFTYAPCVGVQLAKLEVGLRYESFPVSVGGVSSNVSYLGLRIGVNF